jgi:hypothetical protein
MAELYCTSHDGFHRRVSWLSELDHLRVPIVETLDLSEPNASKLSDTAFGFLAPKAIGFEGLAGTTFADFVCGNSAAVNARDGEKVLERDPAAAARIAASRIFKWLEREVLGPQDVLVDISHLLQRAPYLLMGDIRDPSVWASAASGDRSVVSHLVPSDAWFAAEDWLIRPAVWWERVERLPEVREARAKFDFGVVPDLVFLEDASCFGQLGEATEFRAGFHNAFDRRYVAKFGDVTYAPQRRFAFGS